MAVEDQSVWQWIANAATLAVGTLLALVSRADKKGRDELWLQVDGIKEHYVRRDDFAVAMSDFKNGLSTAMSDFKAGQSEILTEVRSVRDRQHEMANHVHVMRGRIEKLP